MRALRDIPLPQLLLLLLACGRAEGGDVEALQQIPQLSYDEVALAASNATARCKLLPQLCAWQLHLYEGHAFRVELPTKEQTVTEPPPVATTQTPPTAPTLLFSVPSGEYAHALLFYAQVERRFNPKANLKLKSKMAQRKRRVMQARGEI